MSEQIIRYIEQYRGIYTREAIEQSLLQAGYAPADIEAAWQALGSRQGRFGDEADAQSPQSSRITSIPAFWVTLFLTMLLLCGVGFSGLGFYGVGQLGSWLALALVVAVLIAGIALLRRNRPVALGLLYGLVGAIVLPLVLLLAVAGICLVGGFRF